MGVFVELYFERKDIEIDGTKIETLENQLAIAIQQRRNYFL